MACAVAHTAAPIPSTPFVGPIGSRQRLPAAGCRWCTVTPVRLNQWCQFRSVLGLNNCIRFLISLSLIDIPRVTLYQRLGPEANVAAEECFCYRVLGYKVLVVDPNLSFS